MEYFAGDVLPTGYTCIQVKFYSSRSYNSQFVGKDSLTTMLRRNAPASFAAIRGFRPLQAAFPSGFGRD
jgi:hypothetical protein